MIYTTRIGPFAQFQGGHGPQYVDVLVILKYGAVEADLADEQSSEIVRFLKMKCREMPKDEKAQAAVLAYVCAQDAACVFTGGSLKVTAGPGPHADINIRGEEGAAPTRQKDFFNSKCEAWCTAASQIIAEPAG